MMHRKLLWGLVGAMSFGCGGSAPTIRQRAPTADRPGIPRITAERLQECVREYGDQLEGGSWAFGPTIQVDSEGYVVNVDDGGVPKTAAELAACTRSAWTDMAIPSSVFDLRAKQLASTNEPTVEQRSYSSHPAVVVIVVVGLGEIALEAGAITILFAVTVKVVDKAVDDVAEAAKKWRPKPTLNRCLDAAAGGGALWENLCNAFRSSVERAECWDKNLLSEQMKRNWCFSKFRN
jgi:hypothetical protein